VEKKEKTKKARNFAYYLLAIVCATSLFSFEFFPDETTEHQEATKLWRADKKERTRTLTKVKELAKGSPEYAAYSKAAKKTNSSYEKLEKVRKEDEFFGFTNKQQFFGEFGPMLCFFIYSLFNLFRSFYFERKNTGAKVFHGIIISGTLFYFFWIFQAFQDFSKITYYSMTLIMGGLVVLAVYLITRYQNHYINRLKKNIRDLVAFTFVNTKQEKKEEMIETLEKMSKDF
jgi:hypothetical protein